MLKLQMKVTLAVKVFSPTDPDPYGVTRLMNSGVLGSLAAGWEQQMQSSLLD